MQNYRFPFFPTYPLDGMCSDDTSFEDYADASHFSFAFAPSGDFVVDMPSFAKAMVVANVSDEKGFLSAIASHRNGVNIIIRLTCDIVMTTTIVISGTGDLIIDGCGHRISFIKTRYTPKSYTGDFAVCPYKEEKIEGRESFVASNGKIIRLSRSGFYDAAGEITMDTNDQQTLLNSQDGETDNAIYSFRLPKDLDNLSISQDEDVYVNFTSSFKSFTINAWTAKKGGYNYLCFKENKKSYNDDYSGYKRYTSFFFINKDLTQESCLIKGKNLYFPSQYDWIGELGEGFTVSKGNVKFKNLSLVGKRAIIENGDTEVTLQEGKIYGTAENAIEIKYGKAYISQCEVFNTLKYGVLAEYGTTLCVVDSYFHNIGLYREQSEAIESRGKYYIARNRIEDFCYGAIRVGLINAPSSSTGTNGLSCSGIVEHNNMSLSTTFYENADHLVVMDSGVIYIATNNGDVQKPEDTETFIKNNIGRTLDTTKVCVVRYNHIKNYRGRGSNRGIFCDDDAYNFLLLGNIIENTPDDYSISARFAESERTTFHRKKNYNKKVFYNIVDNGFRFEGNLRPVITEDKLKNTEEFDGCQMKYNLYLNRYGNRNNIIRYTSREDNVYVDDTGYFTADGRIDSAYNIKEWNINIKNRRHERK